MNYPVSNIDDTYLACNPDIPLENDDVRYTDLSEVRGEDQNFVDAIAKSMIMALKDSSQRYYRQLVTGHRGCGKSTELLRLQARLQQKGFFVVYFDVELLLNLGDVSYIDILLLIARQVETTFREQKIQLNQALLEDIFHWLADTTITKERQKDLHVETTVEAETGVKIPLIGKLLARLSAGVRSNEIERQEIRQTLRKEWDIFIQKFNTLLEQARLKVKQSKYHDLIVIVDGLEKMFYEPIRDNAGNLTGESTHSMLFVKQADQLMVPACHLIYTVPISLLFNQNLANAFDIDTPVVIPMVNLKRVEGVQQLTVLLAKRVQLEQVFENPDLVERLVRMSGGAVRDLMRLVRMVCINAKTAQIQTGDVEKAVRSLVREYDRLIQEKDIDALRAVFNNKRVTGDEKYARLLHNRVIHEYQNGERSADLHPAVQQVSWAMKLIQST